MKPPAPADTGRVPYTERFDIIHQWCRCAWEVRRLHDGTIVEYHRLVSVDPACTLHGDDAKPTPF